MINEHTVANPNGSGSTTLTKTVRVVMMPPLKCWIGVDGYPQKPVPYVLIYNQHGNFVMGVAKDSPEGEAALARYQCRANAQNRDIGWRKHYHDIRQRFSSLLGLIRNIYTNRRSSGSVEGRKATATVPVPVPPKPRPRLRPVSWLYSKGNPHGGLLLCDQFNNQYCAYGPLWGLSQIGSWTQHTTAPNPPMNDSVLKAISGEFLIDDMLPERLKWLTSMSDNECGDDDLQQQSDCGDIAEPPTSL